MSSGFDAPGIWPPGVLPTPFLAPAGVSVLRIATAAYYSRPTDSPASTGWEPRILGDLEIGQSALALGIGGLVALTVSEADLWDGDGWAADLARYDTATGRTAVVRTVEILDQSASDFGTPFAGAELVFSGVVRSLERAAGTRARLALGDITDRLDVPLQPNVYAGTGGLEGGADLKGRPKPVCVGHNYNFGPVFLGNADLGAGTLPTYAVHWRSVAQIEAVRIRGVAQTLVAGTPTVGQARDWPSAGLLQIGSTPDGEVTADARGDDVGGYVNTTATVVRRLLQSLGPQITDAEIHTSAWSQADFDMPGEIGWYRGADPISATQAVREILAGCGGVLAGARAGRLKLIDPIATGTPQFDVVPEWIVHLEPVPLPALLQPAPREVTVQWGRNWRPVSGVAASVPAAERQRLESADPPSVTATSALVTARVAQQRTLTLPGLYWNATAAQVRADALRDWIAAGPRAVRVVTDQYLGRIELGQVGRVTYPVYGLESGMTGVVLEWRERLAGRQVEFTLVGSG